MKLSKVAMTFVLVGTVSACAGGYAGNRYQPVIDTVGSPGMDQTMYQIDLDACNQLAAQRPQMREAARGFGMGAVLGAAGGAIIGAAAGHPGKGAGYGAAGGALLGGAGSGIQGNTARQTVVMSCMERRGWSVLGR